MSDINPRVDKEEGKEEMAREIARQMIRMSRPLEEICLLTGLSMAAVQILLDQGLF